MDAKRKAEIQWELDNDPAKFKLHEAEYLKEGFRTMESAQLAKPKKQDAYEVDHAAIAKTKETYKSR